MPLKLIEPSDIESLTNSRAGELKLGETVHLGAEIILEELKSIPAQFVLFGVKEDAGPRANHGKAGARSAWEYFLPALLNVQDNDFLSGDSVLLLGELDYTDEIEHESNDIETLRSLVEKIDKEVSELVELIVKAGKIPILVGGGHNNSYGLLKGASKALNKAINCINLDPHADYRDLEGRHSGNGFSYAKNEGYLDQYYICGLHQSYNSQSMLQKLHDSEDISYSTFDAAIIQRRSTLKESISKGVSFVSNSQFGIELDCDSIQQFPVSAKTSSGVSPNQARMFTYSMGAQTNAIYFHLTEAAPVLAGEEAPIWGKLMAYLVTDFMKAKLSMITNS